MPKNCFIGCAVFTPFVRNIEKYMWSLMDEYDRLLMAAFPENAIGFNWEIKVAGWVW